MYESKYPFWHFGSEENAEALLLLLLYCKKMRKA
jgi:hypothetical protein